MLTLRQHNLDLHLARGADGFQVRLSAPEVGEARSALGALPAPGAPGAWEDLDAQAELGTRLFNALFRNGVLAGLGRARDAAERAGAALRIRLRLDEVPELAGLPWELLRDPARDGFLALSAHTPIVRYMTLDRPPPRPTLLERLTMLAFGAGPVDQPELDIPGELTLLGEAVNAATALRLVSARGTVGALREALAAESPQILHFVGHGGIVDGEGQLLVEDEGGRSAPLDGERLRSLLANSGGPELVVLNSCDGALAGSGDAFSGVAQRLVQGGVPAVIAMQGTIRDTDAKLFAREFYGALAEGHDVPRALTEARKMLFVERSPAWAAPALFLRGEGVAFRPRPRVRGGDGEDASDLFISYGPRERGWVRDRLVPELEARGLRLHVDYRDFQPGLPRILNAERAVTSSEHTLVILTPSWLESEWGQFQALLAGSRDPAGRRRRLIPLLLEPVELPLYLRMLEPVDLTEPAERATQLERLAASIAPDQGARRTPHSS